MSLKNGIGFVVLLGLLAAAPAHAEMTSLAKVVGLGQSVQCTYQKTDQDGSQSGTIYTANQEMRGEIQVSSSEGSSLINMLREGDWQYIWGGPFGETQGMKMPVSAANSNRGPHGKEGPDFNEDMDIQCKPWTVDASKFLVPDNVQFMEMGQMVPGGMGAAGGGMDMHAIQCGACNQAPEEERAQCLQMMGC